VADPAECVTELVKASLGAGWSVHNLAADGFTSADTLHGGVVRVSRAARVRVGDPLPDEDGAGQFTPLVHLACLPGIAEGFAVLSVGGNDLREVRRRQRRLA